MTQALQKRKISDLKYDLKILKKILARKCQQNIYYDLVVFSLQHKPGNILKSM